MPRSVFSDAYAAFIAGLVVARKEAGVSQAELARRIGRTQPFVSLVERRVRRLDVIEFHAVARAIGADPTELYGRLTEQLPSDIAI